jgi:hypothetical protein
MNTGFKKRVIGHPGTRKNATRLFSNERQLRHGQNRIVSKQVLLSEALQGGMISTPELQNSFPSPSL